MRLQQFLALLIISFAALTTTPLAFGADEHKNNFNQKRDELKAKYRWVYFGHEYKWENAAKYAAQYWSGDSVQATQTILNVVGGDFEGLQKSMNQNGIDPSRDRIGIGVLRIDNWWRLKTFVGTTGWNRNLPTMRKYCYVTKSGDSTPGITFNAPPSRQPMTVVFTSVKCLNKQETSADDCFIKYYADGVYAGKHPSGGNDDFNMRKNRTRNLNFRTTVREHAILQLWEKDFRENDFFGEVKLTYAALKAGTVPNPVLISNSHGRNYRYHVYWNVSF